MSLFLKEAGAPFFMGAVGRSGSASGQIGLLLLSHNDLRDLQWWSRQIASKRLDPPTARLFICLMAYRRAAIDPMDEVNLLTISHSLSTMR